MVEEKNQTYTAFCGSKKVAAGPLEGVISPLVRAQKKRPDETILIFSDLTGKQMDIDLSGSEKDILKRLRVFLAGEENIQKSPEEKGPGRPRLGVVAREVSLLPRHWEWLSTQPGGASGTLRRLVEEGRKNISGREKLRAAQERIHRFLTSMAGNLPAYEEALRALYAKDETTFKQCMRGWPIDIRTHALTLSQGCF